MLIEVSNLKKMATRRLEYSCGPELAAGRASCPKGSSF